MSDPRDPLDTVPPYLAASVAGVVLVLLVIVVLLLAFVGPSDQSKGRRLGDGDETAAGPSESSSLRGVDAVKKSTAETLAEPSREPTAVKRGVSTWFSADQKSTDVPRTSRARHARPEDEHVEKGFAAGRRGDWDLAVAEFTTAIQSGSSDTRAYWGRAWAECCRGNSSDVESAINDATTANQIAPNDPAGYCTHGAATLLHHRLIRHEDTVDLRLSDAVPPLTVAIRLDPSNASYYRLRAIALGSFPMRGVDYSSGGYGYSPESEKDIADAERLEAKAGTHPTDRMKNAEAWAIPWAQVDITVREEMTRGLFLSADVTPEPR